MIARRTKLGILTIVLASAAAAVALVSPSKPPSERLSASATATPTPNPMDKLRSHFESVGTSIPAPRAKAENEPLPGPAEFLAHQFPTKTPRPMAVQQGGGGSPSTGSVSNSAPPASTSDGAAFIDTLRELQEKETPIPFSQQIYGAWTNNTPLPTPSATGSPTITPTPTVTPTPTLERVGGMPTGYTMLYLMQSKARATVERQIQFMLDSEVNDLYLAVLADGNPMADRFYPGTFGTDYAYLSSVVRRLNTGGRTLTLVIYFTNGSAMRNFETSTPDGLFNNVPPEYFVTYITNSPEVQGWFRQTVTKANQVFDLNRSLNPKNVNYAIPMLEDNLTYDAWVTMRRIVQAAVDDRAVVMRNPCLGCYSGLQSNADPVGSGLESHTPSEIESLTKKDGFSMDGIGYRFPWESPSESTISIDQTKDLKLRGVSRGIRFFGLWRAGRQGLAGTTTATPPSERIYEVPGDDQRPFEIEMLRFGLKPVSESSARDSG